MVWHFSFLSGYPLGVVVVDSVFFDFRVYKGSVNTEIKEHGIIICRFEAQLR